MQDLLKFYIDGQWVSPSGTGTFQMINPSTEEPNGRLALGDATDVDRAVMAARRAFSKYSQTSRDERLSLLRRIVEGCQARSAELCAAITDEMGCPEWLAQQAQIPMSIGHIVEAIEVLKEFKFEHHLGGPMVRKEPIGVAALITPWNWPMLTTVTKVIPALACGCTVVLKPSEFAPLSARVFTEILHEAGVPPGVFNLVYGDGPVVGVALSSHPEVDVVSITGSTRAGIEVARNAAATVKRVHQELGGKSPNLILPDANFEKAVTNCVRFVNTNAGQNCSTPTRMVVPRARQAEVVSLVLKELELIKVGTPSSGEFVGPVVNVGQFNRIQGLIAKGIEEGATLVAGGLGRPQGMEKGYYVKSTVFSDVTPSMTVVREEIFGPVLVIQSYENEEDGIRIANDTPYGLAAYVYAGSIERAREVGSRIRAGQVFLNGDFDLMNLKAPFGGCKMSGNGREWGAAGFEAFLEDIAYMGFDPVALAA